MKRILIFLLICFSVILKMQAEQLVQVSQGILNGTIQESRNGRHFSAFLGIPYGKPPVENLRFRKPEPAEKWDGVRQADSIGNRCYQTFFGLYTYGKEDCLNLNVYTPLVNFKLTSKIDQRSNLLPVMIFIHGGAFFFGSGDTYGANYFLDKDIVLVTINYRLGIFGFLTTGDSEAPGNYGLKDQVLALKWVQKNIMAFGGDPKRVTIFGQSAGAASVNFHVLSKASDGLFQQYIRHSGTAVARWAYNEKNKNREIVEKAAKLVFCPIFPTHSLINCMRQKSAESLLTVSNLVGVVPGIVEFTWLPTIEPDSEDAFLTDNPKNLINQMKDLPFISGIVRNEGQLFTFPFYSFKRMLFFFQEFIDEKLLPMLDFNLKTKEQFVTKLKNFYLRDDLNLSNNRQALDGYTNLITDGFFAYPEVRMLKKINKKMKKPNYLYSYGYHSDYSIFQNILNDNRNYGVSHADELLSLFPIHFGWLNTTNIIFSPSSVKISKLMVDLWTSFATNGIPTSPEMNVEWKPYNIHNNTHLQIGNIKNNTDPEVTLSNDFYTDRMNFWKENTIS